MSGATIEGANANDTLGRFHQELKAAVLARVPLELGVSRSGIPTRRASVANLAALEKLIREQLSGGQTLVQLFGGENDALPSRYRAAFRLFEQTETTPLLLDGLAHGVRTRRQLSRVLRWTLIYLAIVLFVATMMLSFYSVFIVPTISKFREDLTLTPVVPVPDRFDPLVWLPAGMTIAGVLMYVPLLLLVFGGSSKLATWLGGRRVQTQRAAALALRTIQSLVSKGVPTSEATAIGCNLVGNERRVRAIVDHVLQGREQESLSAEQLDAAADHLQASANNRLSALGAVLPSSILGLIGGGLVATYCFALFWPVITLIGDLTLPGG